jgi:hypothetical protein
MYTQTDRQTDKYRRNSITKQHVSFQHWFSPTNYRHSISQTLSRYIPVELLQNICIKLYFQFSPKLQLRDLRLSQRCCWNLKSSGVWRLVFGWVVTDVWKERVIFIFIFKQSVVLHKFRTCSRWRFLSSTSQIRKSNLLLLFIVGNEKLKTFSVTIFLNNFVEICHLF